MRAINVNAQRQVPDEGTTDHSLTGSGANYPQPYPSKITLPQNETSPRRLPSARLSKPKILLYSHDTFGLGNIRRTLLLAQELIEQYPGAAILLVTGSQMIHSFRI